VLVVAVNQYGFVRHGSSHDMTGSLQLRSSRHALKLMLQSSIM
jgi:hypothetical protein